MKIEWKNVIKICLCVFVLYLCIYYLDFVQGFLATLLSASMPLIIGCAIAYPVNILMSFYERHFFPNTKNRFLIKIRRAVCMIGAFLSLIGIVVLIIRLIVPQIISCIKMIVYALPGAINAVISYVNSLNILPDNIMEIIPSDFDWQSRLGDIMKVFTSGVGNLMNIMINAVTSIFSGIVAGLLSIMFAVYILYSKDKLKTQILKTAKHYLPKRLHKKTKHFFNILNECFHNYIVGQCTEAVILGILCTLGMMLLRLPYATMIGAVVAFTALIPIAGAYIGAFIGAFMIVMVSPVKALIFLVFIVVLQQIEGNIIYPKVVGSSIGLPGIWVLAAVTIGSGIMGITGLIISVPLAACVYRLIKEDVNKADKPPKASHK